MSVDLTRPSAEEIQVAPAPDEPIHRGLRDFTLQQILLLAYGKVRRWYVGHFRRAYIAQQTTARQGSCSRCGACCKLLFRCPFLLEEVPGTYTCRIHGNKPENCHIFPISKADLRDRDLVMPSQKCGYHFD